MEPLMSILLLGAAVAIIVLFAIRGRNQQGSGPSAKAGQQQIRVDQLISESDDLVGTYADLLEGNKTDVLRPESSLPAPKEAIKRALVITAASKLRAGVITEVEVEIYRTAYMLLTNFVPDDQAQRVREANDAARAWSGSPDQSDEELVKVMEKFSGTAGLWRRPAGEDLKLLNEFDTRLAALRGTSDS